MPVYMSICDGDESDQYGPFPDREAAAARLLEKGFRYSKKNMCWTKDIGNQHLTVSLEDLLTPEQFRAKRW
jgi:hypothetical protein